MHPQKVLWRTHSEEGGGTRYTSPRRVPQNFRRLFLYPKDRTVACKIFLDPFFGPNIKGKSWGGTFPQDFGEMSPLQKRQRRPCYVPKLRYKGTRTRGRVGEIGIAPPWGMGGSLKPSRRRRNFFLTFFFAEDDYFFGAFLEGNGLFGKLLQGKSIFVTIFADF